MGYIQNSRSRSKYTSSFLTVTETLEAFHLKLSQPVCCAGPTTFSASVTFLWSATVWAVEMKYGLKVHFCQVPQNHPLFWLFAYFAQGQYDLCLNWSPGQFFSRRRLSLFCGTIAWLASDRLGHIMHWHWFFFSSLSYHFFVTHQFPTTHHRSRRTHPLRNSGVSCWRSKVASLELISKKWQNE